MFFSFNILMSNVVSLFHERMFSNSKSYLADEILYAQYILFSESSFLNFSALRPSSGDCCLLECINQQPYQLSFHGHFWLKNWVGTVDSYIPVSSNLLMVTKSQERKTEKTKNTMHKNRHQQIFNLNFKLNFECLMYNFDLSIFFFNFEAYLKQN